MTVPSDDDDDDDGILSVCDEILSFGIYDDDDDDDLAVTVNDTAP